MSPRKLIVAAAFFSLTGCATMTKEPPDYLVKARQAYDQAAAGPAGKLNLESLQLSRRYLDAANAQFAEHGSEKFVKNNAYVALREAQTAEALGKAAQNVAITAKLAEAQKQQQSAAAGGGEAGKGEEADVVVEEEGDKLVITFASFDTGKEEIPEPSVSQLDPLAKQIKDLPKDQKVEIIGYTDSEGPEEFNKELSEKRATTVRDELVSRGVDAEQLTVEGRGEADPMKPEGDDADDPLNRRVEVVLPITTPESVSQNP